MKFKFSLNTKSLDQIIKISKEKYKVEVGVINGGDFIDNKGNITVAGYGLVNEFGSATRGIPERSFIRVPLNLHLNEHIRDYKEKYINFLFKSQKIDKAYNYLGLNAKKIILEAFSTSNDGLWKPNSKRTIKQKGSSKPLIDSGRLRKSISYRVVNND